MKEDKDDLYSFMNVTGQNAAAKSLITKDLGCLILKSI